MSLPDQTPKLPKLPFLIGDILLLGIAVYLVATHPTPLDSTTLIAVVVCVALGTVLAAIPFLADYARRQDEALDERQRGLEALSRTLTGAAEQISIAANGLHQIVEISQKNLKHAEQLPHKLQDKISEFKAQLDNARDDDREELEKEVAELRTSETERLSSLADKIHKSVAELAKLDTATQKNLTARTEFLHHIENTVTRLHTDATTALTEALAAFTRELAAAETKTFAAFDAKLAERTSTLVASLEAAAAKLAPPSGPVSPISTPFTQPSASSPPSETDVAAPPKRPRKPRRDDTPTHVDSSINTSEPPPAPPPAPDISTEAPAAPAPAEPSPVPSNTIPVIEPVAPRSADPFSPPSSTEPAESTLPPVPPETPALTPAAASETPSTPPINRPNRKRAARQPDPELTPSLPLVLEDEPTTETASPFADESPLTTDDAAERVLSSDGATRLIATAYIGIGNRLFIRGDGPGLSWDKGVPLQFVSIGKWRWETSDASTPIRFKLYKNDETECAALGELTLAPGHQQEVTARF